MSAKVGRPRILIVEDNPDTAEVVRELLEGEWEVDVLPSGDCGFAKYYEARSAQVPYDLLLLDSVVGGMSGFRVAERVRQTGDWATPIVIWSSYIFTEVGKPRAKLVGAVLWQKPEAITDLSTRLKTVLECQRK